MHGPSIVSHTAVIWESGIGESGNDESDLPRAPSRQLGPLHCRWRYDNIRIYTNTASSYGGASEITDAMIGASSKALASALKAEELEHRCLMPEVNRLWEVCGIVALAVAKQAITDGVASFTDTDALESRIAAYRWQTAYPEIVRE